MIVFGLQRFAPAERSPPGDMPIDVRLNADFFDSSSFVATVAAAPLLDMKVGNCAGLVVCRWEA
jgi:hypothetical protein